MYKIFIIKPIFWAFFIFSLQVYSCNGQQNEGLTITRDKINDEKKLKLDSLLKEDKIEIINSTFLGNEKRNYYGNQAPNRLDLIWKISLGTGTTKVGSETKTWSGAGWTGQPLAVRHNKILYLIQGAYDHHLKKIEAATGTIIWQYEFEDVLKGTGTIWANPNADSLKNRYIIMQGSRKGNQRSNSSAIVPSYRAVSFITGKDLWQLNSVATESYSRDVDGSAVVVNDTAYIGLENGLFTVFNPDPDKAKIKQGIKQPFIYLQDSLFRKSDKTKHGGNLVTESSPCRLGNKIYVTSGSGHVFGYNMDTKRIDWDFLIGSDMDGSPVVTHDNCLLVSIEKEYIEGKGGVFKLDPSKPADSSCVKWYFPVENRFFVFWYGGIIGSASVNDLYKAKRDTFYHSSGKPILTQKIPHLAAFVAIDENLYIVNQDLIAEGKKVPGPDGKKLYPTPKLVFKYKTGPSISTPLFVQNKIVVATYNGIYLFEHDENLNFKLLDFYQTGSIESTPFVFNKRIYVACRDGNLYCFGEKTE
ncbi:MAG: PQQ-binding-like beta-propeller repeat protein [Bacteroidales bacterium]